MCFPFKTIRPIEGVLFAILFSLSLAAQTTTGRMLGSIRDESGASLPGATVTVTDVQRGNSRTVITDESGAYVIPDLIPSSYTIRVDALRFKSMERPEIRIEVASDVTIDFTMSLGEVNETIVVTETVPLVNTTSATLGGTLSNKEINDLPLNGRNYENL